MIDLKQVIDDVAEGISAIDSSRQPHRDFQPGVGPYGEPQLVRLIANQLNSLPRYARAVQTKRTPDLLIRGEWALEFKIARPFGDNGREAENWSVNLLHPYHGNISTIGDCYKLVDWHGPERKAVVVVGYEHATAKIDLTALIRSFECVAREVCGIALGPRIECRIEGLVHPVHQVVRIFAWEVLT